MKWFLRNLSARQVNKIFFLFLVFSFAGWLLEITELLAGGHGFSTKGYLFVLKPLAHYFPFLQAVPVLGKLPLILGLPLIEMYGIGSLIIIYGFRRQAAHPIALFFTGAIVLTFFELITSYICSLVLHKTFWDYSGRFLNFQGRICFSAAVFWGIGTVAVAKFAFPALEKLYYKICGQKYFTQIIVVFIISASICAMAKYWWFPNLLTD